VLAIALKAQAATTPTELVRHSTDTAPSRGLKPTRKWATVYWKREHIPIVQLGTTDDRGFAPFRDDASTS
jgi:hypothetical protein